MLELSNSQIIIPDLPDFAAIDFESANGDIRSACSVGIVIVKDREIVDRFYSLIKPVPNYYCYWNTKIHGIKQEDTDDAPIFPEVWREASKYVRTLPLVAHNKSFDERCLKACFAHYKMRYPNYQFHCTYRTSVKVFPDLENHQLHTVSAHCGFDLHNHHHALADAEACAYIAMEIFNNA